MTKPGTAERVAAWTTSSDEQIRVEAMRGQLVADGVVMLKYASEAGGRRTHRTSLWRKTPTGGWVMFHHQGTPTG